MKAQKRQSQINLRILGKVLMGLGVSLLVVGACLFAVAFLPVLKEEVRYTFSLKRSSVPIQTIKPIDPRFSIIIPKIGANVRVVADVNPFNPKEYQVALSKGVAQARGSVLPGQVGNTFIFAHSAQNWYVANQYNAVFYLLSKLQKGDEIYVSYNKNIYKYKVSETKQVNDTEVQYLDTIPGKGKTLTLMTCWPPGTTLKRLIVVADILE
jgi:sortase A